MGVVSRRWVWVESMGVASGCGCKEVYRYPHITYPLLYLYPNGADLYVNERQKIRHYRTRSTEESSEVHERLSLELITECFHKLE